MISSRNRNILVFVFVLGFLFVIHRANQYINDRRNHHHDTYMVVKGDKYEKCPDMDMFGFKFSVILVFAALNLLLSIFLIMSI